MEKRDFVTADVYLASALAIQLKRFPQFKNENGRILFVFPLTADLHSAMEGYNRGDLMSAYEFAQTIKKIRAEMVIRREMGRQGE